MENLKINIEKIYSFAAKEAVETLKTTAKKCNEILDNKTGKGNDFLGWVNLPSSITNAELSEIEETAANLQKKAQIIVVIGIGGSYLGAKCAIEALSNNFSQILAGNNGKPLVLFAGQNIGEDYLSEMREVLKNKEWAIIVISKSGTTTEPAIAFRLLKQDIEARYGKAEAKNRIVAITDAKKGALRKLATDEGYKTFVIGDDIGGRFSVLTPVGLLPIAAAGFDIRKMVEGAVIMEKNTAANTADNIAIEYAAARNVLYNQGKKLEILVTYNPKLVYFAEWWKQLYGESEGKDGKGIFPASVNFTADLHSMGQYIQDGLRNIFETVIAIKEADNTLTIPTDKADLDQLNYIAGKRLDYVNKMAELGTQIAHIDGGVPNLRIEIPKLNEFYLGQLFYFFEKACGISGYVLDVNPFDQPGVEAYKKNMFALLGKPGFEEESKKIQARL